MILRLAVDFLLKNLRKSLLSVFLICISTIIIILSVILGENHDNTYKSADSILNSGIKKTAVISLDDFSDDFCDEVAQQPEITCFGTYQLFGCVPIPEISVIQSGQQKTTGGFMNMQYIHKNAVNLFDLDISEGLDPQNLIFENDKKSTQYLYLGSKYKDYIKCGTEYSFNDSITFIVAGFLSDSQKILNENLKYGFDMNTYSTVLDFAYGILCVSEDITCGYFFLCASDDYSLDQAMSKLSEVADKYGIEDISYMKLQDSYEHTNDEWLHVKKILSKLILVVCSSCILMLLCTQILDLFYQMHDLGVMFANGFSVRYLCGIITLKNMIISLFAFVFTAIICFFGIPRLFVMSDDINEMINSVIIKTALPLSLLIIFLINAFITFILILMLRRMSPLKMIGGQND